MKINNILALIFLFLGNHICAQKTVYGLVLDERGDALIGVNILQLSTGAKTITDIDGKFEIQLTSNTSCIKITYIGYKDTVVCNVKDTIISIKLMPNLNFKEKNVVCIDFQYADNIMVGINSDLIHNFYGISLSNFTSYFFNMPLMTVSQFVYSTDFNNNLNLHIGIARFHGKNYKNFHWGVAYDFDKIIINDTKSNLKYYSHKFNTTWNYKTAYLLLGYGYSRINSVFHNGLLAGVAFNIPAVNMRLLAKYN